MTVAAFALECATETCSVAACIATPEGWTVWSVGTHAPGQQLSQLVPLAQRLLCEPALQGVQWQCIGVTTGPGTFTGLRIGLATARTLAQAWDVPIVPVGTLDIVACNVLGYSIPPSNDGDIHQVANASPCPDQPLTVALDARKGELFAATYEKGPWPVPVWGPHAVKPDALPVHGMVTGNGVKRYSIQGSICPERDWWPRAEHVALAAAGLYGPLPRVPWSQVEAFYLRAPDAQVPGFMR